MSESYDAKLCEERHKTIDTKLKDQKDRLDSHSKRLDILEQNEVANRTEIKNLIKKMDTFITVIMWGLGIFVTVSIFILSTLLKK
ncbi:MAG: hemolysin XhlA family protein [Clostridium sp.]|uniref:hemolysin XhlA family protein n=1 Tax=Clostridium sp. TaxID=1506 RepID=UPI0039ED4F78